MPDDLSQIMADMTPDAEGATQKKRWSNGRDTESECRPIVIDLGEDFDPIPPRAWLLGTTFCRQFVSSIIAAGATGKTALRIVQLLSLATGRNLTGEHVFQRCRVMLLGLEDGMEELRRRAHAAIMHYEILQAELRGYFYLVTLPKGGKLVSEKLDTWLRAWIDREIKEKHLDLVCFDPLIKTHDLPENDNNAMDRVSEALVELAITHNIAVDAPHHMRKGTADPGNADNGRGGGAFKDGGRLFYTLTQMQETEAKQFGIPIDARRLYVRVDSAKVNLAPSTKTKWFELIGMRLRNGTELYPSGDEIQVAVSWTPPDTWKDLSNDALNAVLDDIAAGIADGRRYSAASAAKDTAAWRVVQRHCSLKTDAQCRDVIKAWLKTGLLYEQKYTNPKSREDAQGLYVNDTKRPGTETPE